MNNNKIFRVFVGGFLPIQIISVTLKNTNQNFKKIIYSVSYLDIIISGGNPGSIKVSKDDVFVIKRLFDNNKMRRVTFDTYIYNTFIAYTHSKKQIVLDLYWLYYANSEMRDLVMHKMSKGRDVRVDNDVSNLFKSELLSIFKNVKTVIIRTTNYNGDYWYTLSMICLLSLIESTSLDKIIIKAVTYWKDKYNWIESLWNINKESYKSQGTTYHLFSINKMPSSQ